MFIYAYKNPIHMSTFLYSLLLFCAVFVIIYTRKYLWSTVVQAVGA